MCHHWIMNHIVEHARDRQATLQQEASRQRLLLQIGQGEQFVFLRRLALFMGNLLITSGTWLQQRAALEQSRVSVSSLVRTGETECYRYQPNVH